MACVTSLEPLTCLTRLRHLELTGCSSLPDLQPLNRLASLTSLILGKSGNERDAPSLHSLSLTSLKELRYCGDLYGISKLVGLTSVKFEWDEVGEAHEDDLEELVHLPNLKKLYFDCNGEEPLQLIRSTSLTYLVLWGWHGVHWEQLRGMPELRKLGIDGCETPVDVSALSSLRRLEKLWFSNTHITDAFTSLNCLPCLKKVEVWDGSFKPGVSLAQLVERGVDVHIEQ